ncbi:MAG: DUF2062 domain-containing protein [Candidatus Theseobacter exili]|nr:DUF2062 domain-containing protein [Candidatus Theseobacter exili]
MRITNHIKNNLSKLISLKDTPHAIALGISIGIFFGFSPLFGLKTLLAVSFTWIFKGNPIAAAISVNLHDLTLPVFPFFLIWAHSLGCRILHIPVHTVKKLSVSGFRNFPDWLYFIREGEPLILGSAILALPIAILTYYLVLFTFTRWRKHKDSKENR